MCFNLFRIILRDSASDQACRFRWHLGLEMLVRVSLVLSLSLWFVLNRGSAFNLSIVVLNSLSKCFLQDLYLLSSVV